MHIFMTMICVCCLYNQSAWFLPVCTIQIFIVSQCNQVFFNQLFFYNIKCSIERLFVIIDRHTVQFVVEAIYKMCHLVSFITMADYLKWLL